VSRNIVERIRQFNQGRLPDLVKFKLAKLRGSPFVFFRGTCHLFCEDWSASSVAALNAAPLAWLCGDLHLENFGTYKGDNRLVYFDVNDFDESALAPLTWDLARFVTSLFVAAPELQLTAANAGALAHQFLVAYADTLARGQIRSIERPTAVGLVRKLLHALKLRRRAAFLDGHTEVKAAGRRFKFDHEHQLLASTVERTRVSRCIERLGRRQDAVDFFKVLDVARRVAGTGSLGLVRYIVLMEGRGSPNRNFVLDMKEARASALRPYLTAPQPPWASEAERVVVNQARFQSMPPALLTTVTLGRRHFIVRELQPLQDRVSLADWDGRLSRASKVVQTMAEVTAWGHLRCSGRQGSAIADELMAFGRAPGWQAELLHYARGYAAQVAADYKEYAAAYDQTTGFS
jgi:uncharacterized protein (DUF2252 family)